MTDIAAFADRWGWGVTLLAGIAYLIAKERKALFDFISKLLQGRQYTKQKVQEFELDQKTKAAELTFEEKERRDTIVALNQTLHLLAEDKKQAQQERKELQDQLVAIVKEQARREAETTAVLQGLARVVTLQTDRLTELTGVIEKIVGAGCPIS